MRDRRRNPDRLTRRARMAMTPADVVRILLRERGMTLKLVADLNDISRTWISKVIHGRADGDGGQAVEALARALECTPEDIRELCGLTKHGDD